MTRVTGTAGRLITCGLAVVGLAVLVAAPAHAAETATASKTTDILNSEQIRIYWSGFGGQTIAIQQCNGKADDAGFNWTVDCGPREFKHGSYTQTGTTCPGGTGSAVPCNQGINRDYRVFVDFDVTELGWECGPADVPADEPGDVKHSTCFIRLTYQNVPQNTAALIPLTWNEAPSPVVPEAPTVVLLTVTALASLGGVVLYTRTRRARAVSAMR